MAKDTGFLEYGRVNPGYRPLEERIKDFREVDATMPTKDVEIQAARCMDCGIPFCHAGCPVENIIPEWNDLVYRGELEEASRILHSTNNFPDFTGRICPAPCEGSCVLGINQDPVSIKLVEKTISEEAWNEGWIKPRLPVERTHKRVAVIGGGPAGLAAAQQLNRAGHTVTLYERDEKVGGLLRFGIPDFKLDKAVVERRVEQLVAEGVIIETGVNVGVDISADELKTNFDAILITIGAGQPRDLPVPGRDLKGVHFAMEFLTQQNRVVSDLPFAGERLSAEGKHVAVIGGGDTGSDCIGTSNRHGAASIRQFELMPKPPETRSVHTPWPYWPDQLRTSSSHEEGATRQWGIATKELIDDGNGNVKALKYVEVEWTRGDDGRMQMKELPDTETEVEADLVLLAMGFTGPVQGGILEEFDVEFGPRGEVKVDENYETSVPGVYAAGDAMRGASLVVWAIRDGRDAARAIDVALMGQSSLQINHQTVFTR